MPPPIRIVETVRALVKRPWNPGVLTAPAPPPTDMSWFRRRPFQEEELPAALAKPQHPYFSFQTPSMLIDISWLLGKQPPPEEEIVGVVHTPFDAFLSIQPYPVQDISWQRHRVFVEAIEPEAVQAKRWTPHPSEVGALPWAKHRALSIDEDVPTLPVHRLAPWFTFLVSDYVPLLKHKALPDKPDEELPTKHPLGWFHLEPANVAWSKKHITSEEAIELIDRKKLNPGVIPQPATFEFLPWVKHYRPEVVEPEAVQAKRWIPHPSEGGALPWLHSRVIPFAEDVPTIVNRRFSAFFSTQVGVTDFVWMVKHKLPDEYMTDPVHASQWKPWLFTYSPIDSFAWFKQKRIAIQEEAEALIGKRYWSPAFPIQEASPWLYHRALPLAEEVQLPPVKTFQPYLSTQVKVTDFVWMVKHKLPDEYVTDPVHISQWKPWLFTYSPIDSFAWFNKRKVQPEPIEVTSPIPAKWLPFYTSEVGWWLKKRPQVESIEPEPELRVSPHWIPTFIVPPADNLPWLKKFRVQQETDTIDVPPPRFRIAILSPLPPPVPVGAYTMPIFVSLVGIRSFLSSDL